MTMRIYLKNKENKELFEKMTRYQQKYYHNKRLARTY